MSVKTTILELRQLENIEQTPVLADGTMQNGLWTNTLDVPIVIEAGDQISVKSCYLDTAASSSGFIEVENDIPVSMSAAMYLTNYDKDQQYTWQNAYGALPTGLGNFRDYGPTHNPLRSDNELGDNNKWVLAEASESVGFTWILPSVIITPDVKGNNSNHYGGGVITLEYTGTQPGATPFGMRHPLNIERTKDKDLHKYNPYAINVRCKGSATIPEIRVSANTPLSGLGIVGINFTQTAKPPFAAGATIVTPQIFTHEFTIKGGPGVVYSPLEISQLITNEVNNAQQTGPVSINYLNAGSYTYPSPKPTVPVNTMTEYPAMSKFLTTVLKNQKEIEAKAGAAETHQIFVNASGYSQLSEQQGVPINANGDFYFEYNGPRMMNERVTTPAAPTAAIPNPPLTRNPVDTWIGCNQLAMVFDEVENKLKWEIQHFPIYSGETTGGGATGNDGRPTARYNDAESNTDFTVNKGVALQYSGIVWTDLSPPSFWTDTLGFAGVATPPNMNQGRLSYDNSPAPPAGVFNSFELEIVEGVNTTGALPGLDLGVVHANANYSRPVQGGAGGVGALSDVNRQTDDTSSIFSQRTWNTSVADEGYFVLDMSTNFTQNLIASNLSSHNTQSIINRYYTANSFTSDQGAGSIMYEHSGEPIMLSEFNIAIRNPDRTLVAPHILQQKNSIFVEILKGASN
jgi:hypothetical protein